MSSVEDPSQLIVTFQLRICDSNARVTKRLGSEPIWPLGVMRENLRESVDAFLRLLSMSSSNLTYIM